MNLIKYVEYLMNLIKYEEYLMFMHLNMSANNAYYDISQILWKHVKN